MNNSVSRKKILFVSTVPETIEAFLLPFADKLREDNWIAHAMANGISEDSSLTSHFDKLWDVPFSRNLGSIVFSLPVNVRQIKRILDKEKYTIIHTHTPIASFVVRFAAGRMEKPIRSKIIYTAHGFHFHDLGGKLTNTLYLEAEKLGARWTDILIVINEEDYQSAISKSMVAVEKVRRLPGIGVDTLLFDPGRYNEREVEEEKGELGIPERTKIFLMPAEFIPRKRHIDAIRAMELLARKDVCLLFAGTGKLEDSLKKNVKQRDMDEQIRFLGFRDNMPLLMKISAAVILPSQQEGLPRVLLEAMSMNTPAIATDIRGNRELLQNGCGILVPPRSPKYLAEAISWILENGCKARNMGKKGRPIVLSRYDQEIVLSKQMEIYYELIHKDN
jgi:glycosyltransferase involved in cell wall biosynthesis